MKAVPVFSIKHCSRDLNSFLLCTIGLRFQKINIPFYFPALLMVKIFLYLAAATKTRAPASPVHTESLEISKNVAVDSKRYKENRKETKFLLSGGKLGFINPRPWYLEKQQKHMRGRYICLADTIVFVNVHACMFVCEMVRVSVCVSEGPVFK